MKKETAFKIIAISLPFVAIIFVEIALRIAGYGVDEPLFHEADVGEYVPHDYLVMNPKVAMRYFKTKGFEADNQSDKFLKVKTDSTFRIFIQGASTIVGFPYYGSGSFPRLLKHRLSQTFPDKNIEVINTGITAVNSYTLWDLTDEIIEQKPDLVIIYAGHNEYYGALGVGSSSFMGSHPILIRTFLAMKDFRLLKLLGDQYAKLLSSGKEQLKVGESTLMEVMAREQRIPYDSDLYQAGIEQFESNLTRILEKYQSHNIPVILSTLVSNEKDIKPFISDSSQNQNADSAYYLGRKYLAENLDSAQKYMGLAKEWDLLRFRAPEKINETIHRLAQEYGTHLVDMKKIFEERTREGIVDDELLSEHVHPNVRGYFLMADAFYHTMRGINLPNDWTGYTSYDEALQDLPVTRIDSLKGKYVIDDLKQSWPYVLDMSRTSPESAYDRVVNKNYEQTLALDLYLKRKEWEAVMRAWLGRCRRVEDHRESLRIAQSMILEYPEIAENYQLAAEMCINLGDSTRASYYQLKYDRLTSMSKVD